MGIAGATRSQYETAIKKLFPQGGYWDKEFADPASDVSLFCRAKAEELFTFRERMNALQNESRIETTSELVADWERVLLGSVTYGKTLTERRLLLKSKEDNRLNRAELQKIAELYGLMFIDITFPYRPAFFGHAFFNTSALGGPVVFSVPLISAAWGRAKFWNLFKEGHPVQQFGRTQFALDRLAWFPVSVLRLYLGKTLRAASAGFFKMGVQRLFPSPVYLIRPLAENRLRAGSAGFMRFGTGCLMYSPVPAMRRITARRVREGSAGFTRAGKDRLMYTPAYAIRRAVHDRLRAASAGFARYGQNRLMPLPLYQIGKLLREQFRAVSFGAAKFGLSRLALYCGGFSRSLVSGETWLFNQFVKAVFQISGIAPRTDAQIVDAVTRDNGFLPRFDTALIRELVRQAGLLPEFDRCFMQRLIQENRIFSRLEKSFINYIVREKQLFRDFELAVQDKLLASQIPYFSYEGV